MAPNPKGKYQGKMGWLNGKWVTLRIKDKTKLSAGWTKWEETKGQDWACCICDPYVDDATDFYMGNYASEKKLPRVRHTERRLPAYAHVHAYLEEEARYIEATRRV